MAKQIVEVTRTSEKGEFNGLETSLFFEGDIEIVDSVGLHKCSFMKISSKKDIVKITGYSYL